MIEPHAGLLKKPDKQALLYKVIPSRYFLDMLEKNYFFFKRVDTYHDDTSDSAQPLNHKEKYGNIPFINKPEFTLTDYYNRCRARTYACCFSTENTGYLFEHYSKGDLNAVCLVFKCGLLIDQINSLFDKISINYNNIYKNFFFINYGLVKYGAFNNFIQKSEVAVNPIEFAYFKDEKYSAEKEFRITVSTHGIYESFMLPDKSKFSFPDSIILELNFREALSSNALKELLISPNSNDDFKKELENKLRACKIDIKFMVK